MVGRGSRVIKILWIVSLFAQNTFGLAVAATPSSPTYHNGLVTYNEIGEKIISAEGIIATDNEQLGYTFDEHGIPQLTLQEQRKLIFSILSHAEKHQQAVEGQQYIHQATRTLMSDLELFYAQGLGGNNNHLFSKFNCTQTLFGEAVLAKMLVTPTDDAQLLRKRQAFIAELLMNDALFNELDAIVKKMKQVEPALLSFWIDEDPTTQAFIKSLYFTDAKAWNKKPLMLEANTCLSYLALLQPVLYDVAMAAVYSFVNDRLVEAESKNIQPMSMSKAISDAFKMVCIPVDDIARFQGLYDGTLSTADYFRQEEKFVVVTDEAKQRIGAMKYAGLKIIFKLSMAAVKLIAMRNVADNMVYMRDQLNQVQSKLIGVSGFLDGLKNIDCIMHDHAVVAQGLVNAQAIEQFSNPATISSKTLHELLTHLQTATFRGEASFFSHMGRVLRSYDLMKKAKQEFGVAMQAYGELDACLSIVKLLKKFENERVHYCFVQYVDQAEPYLKLEAFWNPQVNPAVVVTNNIELGANGKHRNMILTGSNTGGKSTLLKAVVINIQLAQTFGIAPAQSATMTPFAFLGTSLNIVDNTAEGKSLYQAEVDRAASLMNAAEKLERLGKPCFLIMDELFRGTGPEKADFETYACAQNLTNRNHTSFILATHFVNHPIKLEAETQAICKNFKVEVFTENGKLIRTFKLEEGVNTSNVAGTILRSALDKNTH